MKKLVAGVAVVYGILVAIDYAIEYMVESEEAQAAWNDLRE